MATITIRGDSPPDTSYPSQLKYLFVNDVFEIPHDSLPGENGPATKKRNLIVGTTESGGVLIQNKSVYQQHIVEFNKHTWPSKMDAFPKADWLVRFSEIDKGVPLGTPRTISITKLVHLLMNITDDEINEIVDRVNLAEIFGK